MENLLFGNPLYSSDDYSLHYLESSLPKVEGEVYLDGKTYPLVKPQPIPDRFTRDTSAFEAETMIIYLTDLGHAQRAGQPTTDCFGAFALRAPETIIGLDFGPGIDIWAVGCIRFELLVGRWLFHPEESEDWTAENEHLAKMTELTGQSFPESVLQRATRRKDFFDAAGNLRRISGLIPVGLETAMANYKVPGLAEDRIKKAADFIRACLQFDYKERATAEEFKRSIFLPMLSGARVECLARAAPRNWDCVCVNEYRTLHVLEEHPSYWNLESIVPSGLVSDVCPVSPRPC